MTSINYQAGLAGLASTSMIIAVLSVVSVLGFGAIETLARLRLGRRRHLSTVPSGASPHIAEQSVASSGQRRRHDTGKSNVSALGQQLDPSAIASFGSRPFNRDMHILEEAFGQESAPDTGPRGVGYLQDGRIANKGERFEGAGRENRELEYAGHQARRSPGAHRRSK